MKFKDYAIGDFHRYYILVISRACHRRNRRTDSMTVSLPYDQIVEMTRQLMISAINSNALPNANKIQYHTSF
jgi:hypothetical protein